MTRNAYENIYCLEKDTQKAALNARKSTINKQVKGANFSNDHQIAQPDIYNQVLNIEDQQDHKNKIKKGQQPIMPVKTLEVDQNDNE